MPALCARAGLSNRGNLDQYSAKNQPFVRGLSLISGKFGNFGENVARRAGLKNLAQEEAALYGEPAPGFRIHMSKNLHFF